MRLIRIACLAFAAGLSSGGAMAQATPVAATQPMEQGALLQKINGWFNASKVMSGAFVQTGPDGAQTQGKFWVSKPGKMRFDYAPPSPVQLIADGRSVAVRDRKLNTQDLYFIGQTPLRFLLADKIDLVNDTRVLDVRSDAEGASVLLEESSSVGGSSRILLFFSLPDYALSRWVITDAQGFDTSVVISNVDTSSKPDNKLFFINEIRAR